MNTNEQLKSQHWVNDFKQIAFGTCPTNGWTIKTLWYRIKMTSWETFEFSTYREPGKPTRYFLDTALIANNKEIKSINDVTGEEQNAYLFYLWVTENYDSLI